MLTQQEAIKLFRYDNGNLYWKQPIGRRAKGIAGHLNNSGYLTIQHKRKNYLAHRIIYLMFHGYFPDEIDHIDGNRRNNLIENLRPATRKQNLLNSKVSVRNSSGVKNVSLNKKTNKWQLIICGKYIGQFDTLEDAKLEAIKHRVATQGNFARHA